MAIIYNKICSLSRLLRKRLGRLLLLNKDVAIIANNCISADICRTYGLRFNSPTVNLQIFPWQFSEFAENIEEYLNTEIVQMDISKLNDEEGQKITEFYGGRTIKELGFPFGMCGDIIIAFQHYKSFEEAKKKWDERKKRVNIGNVGFILVINEKDMQYAKPFDELKFVQGGRKKQKVIVTINCSYSPMESDTIVVPVKLPPHKHFMERYNLLWKYYEVHFNVIKWINSLK